LPILSSVLVHNNIIGYSIPIFQKNIFLYCRRRRRLVLGAFQKMRRHIFTLFYPNHIIDGATFTYNNNISDRFFFFCDPRRQLLEGIVVRLLYNVYHHITHVILYIYMSRGTYGAARTTVTHTMMMISGVYGKGVDAAR